MKKTVEILCAFMCVAAIWGIVRLALDKQTLRHEIVRLHVVANSDAAADQAVKLLVRDAVLQYVEPLLDDVQNIPQARARLEENLPNVKAAALTCLQTLGVQESVTVHLREEAFGRRDYDTFSLPAGVYESLRVEIGRAEGKNWWCVIFPSLCLEAFRDTAAAAGFSQPLTDSLTGEQGYTVRFFLLDCLGRVENFLFEN